MAWRGMLKTSLTTWFGLCGLFAVDVLFACRRAELRKATMGWRHCVIGAADNLILFLSFLTIDKKRNEADSVFSVSIPLPNGHLLCLLSISYLSISCVLNIVTTKRRIFFIVCATCVLHDLFVCLSVCPVRLRVSC